MARERELFDILNIIQSPCTNQQYHAISFHKKSTTFKSVHDLSFLSLPPAPFLIQSSTRIWLTWAVFPRCWTCAVCPSGTSAGRCVSGGMGSVLPWRTWPRCPPGRTGTGCWCFPEASRARLGQTAAAWGAHCGEAAWGSIGLTWDGNKHVFYMHIDSYYMKQRSLSETTCSLAITVFQGHIIWVVEFSRLHLPYKNTHVAPIRAFEE